MIIDELCPLEKYFYHRSQLKIHPCFYVAVQLNKIPPRTIIRDILKKVIQLHPRLHCNVTTNTPNNEPFIMSVEENIMYDDVVETVDWEDLSEEKINFIFQKYHFAYGVHKPVWKLLIVPSQNKLVLLLSHTLFDGMSAVKFWETFMDNISVDSNETTTTMDDIIFKPGDSKMVSGNNDIYENIPIPLSWKIKRMIVKPLFNYRPSLITGVNSSYLQFNSYNLKDNYLDGDFIIDKEYKIKNNNQHINFNVSNDKLNILLKSCRQKQVSLTSVLVAILIEAFRISDIKNFRGDTIKVDIPMNTRIACQKLLNLDNQRVELGNFVGSLEYECKRENMLDLFQIANEVQKTITYGSKSDILGTLNNVKLLELIDCRQFVQEKVKGGLEGPPGTFEVTNLGFHSFSNSKNTTQEYFIKDAIFNQPQGFSDIFTCNVISTPYGGMNCFISYPSSITEDIKPIWDFFQKYIDDLK